jgi:hypothetical protein
MIGHRITMTLAALLLSCAAVLTTVSSAAGQNAVLYEVTEKMKLKRHDTVRGATAVLMGSVSPGPAICPASLAADLPTGRCAIAATASDRIDLATGMGPVHGTFSILIPGDNPDVDGPELVVAEGSLHGHIDLSPAVLHSIPLGAIEAKWSARGRRGGPLEGLRADGTLTGIFRLPFPHPAPPGAAFLVEGVPVLLRGDELSLGVPTVRLELDFVEDTPSAFRRTRGRD